MVKKSPVKRIYMDHAAATPMDKRVKKAMTPFWVENFGNPNALYKEGLVARKAIEEAREKAAKVLSARVKEIIFTAGGTESDNLAILGVCGAMKQNLSRFTLPRNAVGSDAQKDFASSHLDDHARGAGKSPEAKLPDGSKNSFNHIITTKFEHHAVLNACKFLEAQGFEVTYLGVGKDGIVNPEDVKKALKPETILVTIMYANNEIGTIQPIREIAKVIRNFKKALPGQKPVKPFFHTDACQAPGYLDLSVEKLGVDMLTLNGSKIYGSKGTGLLYVKDGIKLQPLLYGGEQERKLRPGTENVAGIVGLAEALKIAEAEKEKEVKRLSALRDYFTQRLTAEIPKTVLNGHPSERLPNNINVSILDVEGEAVILYLDEKGVSCSTGSACTSESLEPSHVIMSIGRPHAYAHGAMRFSLGRSTTKKDIDYVMKVLPLIVEKLRSMSPTNIKM